MLVEWNSRNLVRRIHGPFELGFMLISARNCRFEILWNQVFENIASDPMMIEDRELLGENQREKQKQNRNKHIRLRILNFKRIPFSNKSSQNFRVTFE